MPLIKGQGKAAMARNIAELHKGPQYAKTAAKHGQDTANRQAVAIAYKTAGKSKKSPKYPMPIGK